MVLFIINGKNITDIQPSVVDIIAPASAVLISQFRLAWHRPTDSINKLVNSLSHGIDIKFTLSLKINHEMY